MKTFEELDLIHTKKKRGVCLVRYCTRPGHNRKGGLCHKHYSHKDKGRNPEAYYFNLLRSNAKTRGKEFTLTLKEFKRFCKETGYLDKKGRKKKDLTIDRIDITKGYSIDNIQVLTNEENLRKYHAFEAKGIPYPGSSEPEPVEDLPF